MKVCHSHRIISAGGGPVRIDRAAVRSDKGAFIVIFPQFNHYSRHIGFFQIGRLGIFLQKFMGRNFEPLGQFQDVVRGQHDLDAAATCRKTLYTRMAAKFQIAVQAQFLGFNRGGVLFLTKNGLLLSTFLICHSITLSNI